MEENQSNDIKAQPAVLTAVIQIKRAATGKVEEYTITGTPLPADRQIEATEDKEAT